MSESSSFSFFADFLACSGIDGCAPVAKPQASLETALVSPRSRQFALGMNVTCKHEVMDEWYHAKIINVRGKGKVDVQYMDGEVEEMKPAFNVFPGALSMEEVRCAVEVRDGVRDDGSGVTLKGKMSVEGEEYVLAGCTGKKNQACVGLFISSSSVTSHLAPAFLDVDSLDLSQSPSFISTLQNECSTMVLITFCAKVSPKDVLKMLEISKSGPFAEQFRKDLGVKNFHAGQSLAFGFSPKKIWMGFNVDSSDKENCRISEVSKENEGELSDVIEVLEKLGGKGGKRKERKERLCWRLPDIIREESSKL